MHLLGEKLVEGQETVEHAGKKIWHNDLIKEDDIFDVMSKKKKKDNFQISELYVAIGWTQILNVFHVNKYRKRKAGCYVKGYYR